jgi:hypothetical protein
VEEQEHDRATGPESGDTHADAAGRESRRHEPPVEAQQGMIKGSDIVPEREEIIGRDRAGIGRATDGDVESPTYGDEGGGQLYGEDDGDET